MGRIAIALCAALALGACSTLPNGRRWGEDATYRPGWDKVGRAALKAARDPRVWIPAIGAGVLQIGDADREVSDWAREHTPVFGSERSADRWSDDLRLASLVAYHASVLATPGGDESGPWLVSKSKGYLVGLTAAGLTSLATGELKSATDRERPNDADRESLPSGHASASAVFTRLASDNLRSTEIGDRVRMPLEVGLDLLSIGTAWARVEAGQHFPSDTLVGIALGNFIAALFNDAFLGLPADPRAEVALVAMADGTGLRCQFRF